jgi:hypothetical protein
LRSEAQMVISVNTPVHDPIQTIESFNNLFGLTVAENELVKKSWENEPSQNMWGIIQAYTGSGKTPELSVESAYKLEKIGGQILAMVK